MLITVMSSSDLRTGLRNRSRPFSVNASDHRGRSLDMLVPPSIARWNGSSEPTEQVEGHVDAQSNWGESTKVVVDLLLTRDIKSTW